MSKIMGDVGDTRRKRVFPFGTHFYREPSRSIEELRHDILIVKNLGFNMIKVQESWSMDEKVEGKIDLRKVDAIIDEAERLGLYVYFGVTMEQAPAWLWRKYPDCRMVYSTGEKHEDPQQYLLPGDGKPGPCWDHPGAREAGYRFVSEVARVIGRHDNILVWNVWQEIGFWPMRNVPGSLGFCYCPHTLARFREWLRGKYGDLCALNKVWRTGYGDWEEVEPPRIYARVPPYIDWSYFMNDVYLARALRWKAEAFRANDPKRRPIFSHVGYPTVGSGAEWRWAAEGEIFGSSCYPAWGPLHEWDACFPAPGQPVPLEEGLRQEVEHIAMGFDYVRSAAGANRQCWAAEFQGGPISTSLHKGRVPSPEDIRRWVLAALSSGINGLCFWNHRVEIFWDEAYGFGLLDARGDHSPRAEEAGRLAMATSRHAELFHDGRVPQADVAILVHEDLWHFARATGNNAASHLSYTVRGIYSMLWEAGVWVDFVEAGEATLNDLRRYKALILPFPLALDDSILELLKDYVASGGTLISEACPGRYDRLGFTRPGELAAGAEELFGVERRSVRLCHEPGQKTRWTPRERSYGEIMKATRFEGTGPFAGHSVLPSLYVETYETKGSTPILLCENEVAGVANDYGRGRAYLVGTFLGHAHSAFRDAATSAFLLDALKASNVGPETCGGFCRRRRIGRESQAWFLFNMEPRSVAGRIEVKGISKVSDLLGAELPSRDGFVTVTVNPLEIKCLIIEP
ncbi:MAG: beta-galactosidase [Candidatus Brockarchaeota archaeon]|nr:beta-galactosidase [Candidatus Brockarchaeota archaeon]